MRYRGIEFKPEIIFTKHPSGATIVESDFKEHIKRIDGIITEREKQERNLKNRNDQIKKTYGITMEDYNQMFDQQAGKCAICEKHQSEFNYKLHIDHNHKTGKVRGLLCSGCNHLLVGLENKIWHKRAMEYLISDYTTYNT